MATDFEKITEANARPVHVYDVPEALGADAKSIGLVELTTEEELAATRRAKGDPMRLGYELAKQSLWEVDGSRVKLVDGSADAAWAKMGPKLRQLTLMAYAELHTPPEGSTDAFLKSRQIRVA